MNASMARLRRGALSFGGILGAGLLGTLICQLIAGFWVPPAAFLKALVYGSLNAMFAIGIVLIYRASRIVNFSQGALGLLGVGTFLVLKAVWGWSYWIAFPAAIAMAAFTGLLVELFIMRRMSKAPRLALTVVTIGLT